MLAHHLPHLSKKHIVLASQSPRRAEILRLLGLDFDIVQSNFNEDLPKDGFDSPGAYCVATAHAKARAVADSLKAGRSGSGSGSRLTRTVENGVCDDSPLKADLVIGSDTIVVLSGFVLEKPASEADAMRMLRRLSGRQHSVVTGVSLITNSGTVRQIVSETAVWFDELSDDVIEAYVKTGEPMDKAGAYGIQGMGGSFVSRIEGCYFTVMGLPLHALAKEMRKLVDDGLL